MEKSLEEIKSEAIRLMKTHGLGDWTFQFDARPVRRFGRCSYGLETISLSIKPIEAGRSWKNTRNTLLHEIAHALVGRGHGHDMVWRAKAIEIGCDGKTHSDAELSDPSKIFKYEATCPNGHKRYRNKPPRGRQSCGSCSSSFNLDYLLTWKKIG